MMERAPALSKGLILGITILLLNAYTVITAGLGSCFQLLLDLPCQIFVYFGKNAWQKY